jgi:carboxylesterase type B
MFTRKVRHLLLDNEPALRAFTCSPGIAWARHQINTGRKPIHTYFFERNIPGDEGGAPHASEIPYIFGTLDCRPLPWEEYDFSLSEAMTDYWTNFAKTGDPNGKVLPRWPAFTAATPFAMNSTDDGFAARDIVDNAEANRVINFTIEHPGMLESLSGF